MSAMYAVNDDFLLDEQKTAIEALEILISDIRAGRVTEFLGVGIHPNGDYHVLGGSTESRHAQAGILLELAIDRLNATIK